MNDEELGLIRIKFNPWLKITIPKSDNTEKRAISAEACREFSIILYPSQNGLPIPELGRDVALLSLCLGGINTIDLYELKRKIITLALSVIKELRPVIAEGMKPTWK